MKSGHYPDGAYVWHDVQYTLQSVDDDSFGNLTAEFVETVPSQFPCEAVIEPSDRYGVAYLTVREFPASRDGPSPKEQTIYVDREQAIQIRDWLIARINESADY